MGSAENHVGEREKPLGDAAGFIEEFMRLKRLENESEMDWMHRQIDANLKAATRNIWIATGLLVIACLIGIVKIISRLWL